MPLSEENFFCFLLAIKKTITLSVVIFSLHILKRGWLCSLSCLCRLCLDNKCIFTAVQMVYKVDRGTKTWTAFHEWGKLYFRLQVIPPNVGGPESSKLPRAPLFKIYVSVLINTNITLLLLLLLLLLLVIIWVWVIEIFECFL